MTIKLLSYSGDASGRYHYFILPKNVEPFLEMDSVIERIRVLVKRDDLTDIQRTALEKFIKGYDLKAVGKEPMTPMDLEGEL